MLYSLFVSDLQHSEEDQRHLFEAESDEAAVALMEAFLVEYASELPENILTGEPYIYLCSIRPGTGPLRSYDEKSDYLDPFGERAVKVAERNNPRG